ncbi:MAG: hypothetical protein H0X51_03920 [Parachlamydiaceae bacterium]|nr:hypothetical protein [Parachlamydiaceae bacterium]
MEKYSFENDFLTLIDNALNLSIEETFNPIRLPQSPTDGERIDGSLVHVIKDDDDQVEEAYLTVDDVRSGQWQLFYPSGTCKMEAFYQDNQLHGPSTFYDEQGNVLAKSWFHKGLRQGKTRWFDSEGNLISLQRFVDGVPKGIQEYYNPDGSRKSFILHEAGKRPCEVQSQL